MQRRLFSGTSSDWPHTDGVNRGVLEIAAAAAGGLLAGAIIMATIQLAGSGTSLLLAVDVVAAVLVAGCCLRRPILIAGYFGWIAIQNMALPWLHSLNVLDVEALRFAIAFKEIVGLCLLVGVCARAVPRKVISGGWRSPDAWLLLYGGVLIVALLIPFSSDAPLGARAVAFRTLVMPAVFIFVGRHFPADSPLIRRIVQAYIAVCAGLAAFGLVERFVLPVDFWRSIVNMGQYITDVKGIAPDFHVEDGLVANMYRFGLRRLVSTFGDPLACGYAFILPTVVGATILLRSNEHDRLIARGRTFLVGSAALLGVGLLMTINRGAILTVLLALGIIAIQRRSVRLVIVIGGAILALMIWQPDIRQLAMETLTMQEGSARSHYDHLVEGIGVLLTPAYLFGLGLGRSGFWAQELFGTTVPGVGENAYFMMIVQIGYAGTGLFIAFMVSTVYRFMDPKRRIGDPYLDGLRTACGATLLAHLLTANTSENIFSFTGMAQAWFIVGLALQVSPSQEGRGRMVG